VNVNSFSAENEICGLILPTDYEVLESRKFMAANLAVF